MAESSLFFFWVVKLHHMLSVFVKVISKLSCSKKKNDVNHNKFQSFHNWNDVRGPSIFGWTVKLQPPEMCAFLHAHLKETWSFKIQTYFIFYCTVHFIVNELYTALKRLTDEVVMYPNGEPQVQSLALIFFSSLKRPVKLYWCYFGCMWIFQSEELHYHRL